MKNMYDRFDQEMTSTKKWHVGDRESVRGAVHCDCIDRRKEFTAVALLDCSIPSHGRRHTTISIPSFLSAYAHFFYRIFYGAGRQKS